MSCPQPHLLACTAVILLVLAAPGMAVSCSGSSSPCGDPLSINGTVFKDIHGYGIRTPDAPGLPGVNVRLMQKGSVICTAMSNGSGGYVFSDLDPGTYYIEPVVPERWNQSLPGCGSHRITLTDRSAHRLDIGLVPEMPTAASGELASDPTTFMHFTAEDLIALGQEQMKMPLVSISPRAKVLVETSPRGNFSLLNYIQYCPRERDQGWCGNCWVWGGTALMEVDLAVNKGIKDRLSIEYFTTRFGKVCCGGTLSYLALGYRMLGMSVPWSNSNAQWQDGYTSCSRDIIVPFSTISATPGYAVSSIEAQRVPTWDIERDEAISNIKSVLLQNRSVSFSFYMPTKSDKDKFVDFWLNKSESDVLKIDYMCGKPWNGSEGVGHMVACVGYNDTDPNNSYWLMLNSWGTTTSRPGGLFRVSMDMNYSCSCIIGNDTLYPAFHWEALNITYPNYPPAIPDRPSGPSSGSAGSDCSFSARTTDPEGDTVRYEFDWGDGTTSVTNAVRSGSDARQSHSWKSSGDYCIRVSAVDDKGASSAWSGPSRIAVRSPAVNRDNIVVGDLSTFGFCGGQATNNIHVSSGQKR